MSTRLDVLLGLVEPAANADENSRAAAHRIREYLRSQNARRIFGAIIEAGPAGMTTDELEAALGQLHQTVSPVVVWGHQHGLLRAIGKRPTRSGRPAHVYVIEPAMLEPAERAPRPVFGRPETGRP